MRRRLLLAAALLALSGCSSPEPAYFTLAPRPGTFVAGAARLIELRRIGLAGYLDRPELVRRSADYRLSINPGERWGEPVGDLLARVLAEDLTQRLPGSSVFTSAGGISANPGATVELDVQRLDADATGQVVLLAQVAVTRGEGRGTAAAQTVRLQVTPADASTTAYVAALSTAVGQLADRIAPMLVNR